MSYQSTLCLVYIYIYYMYQVCVLRRVVVSTSSSIFCRVFMLVFVEQVLIPAGNCTSTTRSRSENTTREQVKHCT